MLKELASLPLPYGRGSVCGLLPSRDREGAVVARLVLSLLRSVAIAR
jgi:hypothetical protein